MVLLPAVFTEHCKKKYRGCRSQNPGMPTGLDSAVPLGRCQPSLPGAIASTSSEFEGELAVAEEETVERARQAQLEGKAPSTQAGEFVREEMHHVREGKHGARSTKQAIAIGLSKARRAGVRLKPPLRQKAKAKAKTRQSAARAYVKGRSGKRIRPSATRSRAVSGALKREGRSAASRKSLARQARSTARVRGAGARRQAAMKAVRTKGKAGLQRAAEKATQTRASHRRAA
jgi:Family of unknown function (DUF6496)